MSRRTLGMETIRFKPEKKRIYGDLGEVDGLDMLHMFHGLISRVDPNRLVDRTHGRYLKIERVHPAGRTVLVRTESGPFGEEGQTIDIATHQTSHRRSVNESATTMTRTLFVVPPNSTVGLFLVERQGLITGGTTIIELFKDALLAHHQSHFFPTETVVETDAWSASAGLLSITTVAYAFPVNIADGLTPTSVPAGTLRQTLEPPSGQRFLPRALWNGIRDRRIQASEFMGFQGQDVDETIVELEKDGQKKSYALGRESQPSVRVLITLEGEPALTDTEFARRAALEARTYYTGMGLTWEDRWLTGGWSDEALAVELDPR
jgi:hypothetical protein